MKDFEYINKMYGVSIKKGTRVKHTSKILYGTVEKSEGQYVYILWDGEFKSKGPYHPTSDLIYSNEKLYDF